MTDKRSTRLARLFDSTTKQIVAVVGAITAIIGLLATLGVPVDVFKNDDKEKQRPGLSVPTTPAETISRSHADRAPTLHGNAEISGGPVAERLARFLRRHDGEAVNLDVTVQGDVSAHTYYEPSWKSVRSLTFATVCLSESRKYCPGLQLLLTRPETEDATIGFNSGSADLIGYFGVDTRLLTRPAHQGIATIRLKPLVVG